MKNLLQAFGELSRSGRIATRRPARTRKLGQGLSLKRLEDRTMLSVVYSNVPNWGLGEQGPAPIVGGSTGAIESIAVVPLGLTQDIVYAGTVNGGIWRTTLTTDLSTGNLTTDPSTIEWTPLTDQQPTLATGSMALDPRDPTGNTLWVGTGERSSEGIGGPNKGLLKTTDGGNTWTDLGQASLAPYRIMSVAPTMFNSLLSGQQIILVAAYDGGGILRSTDGGQTFQSATNQDNGTPLQGNATALVADPGNDLRFFAVIANVGLYESDNAGRTWFSIDPGIPGSSASTIAVHADDTGTTLYAAVASPSGVLNGVYKTELTSAGRVPWAFFGYPGALSVSAITVDPVAANTIYVSAYPSSPSAIYRMDETGSTLISSIGGPHADSRSLTFLTSSFLLETDDGGVFGLDNPQSQTSFGFPNWVALNGNIRDTEFFDVAYDSHQGFIFGGSQDNGTPIQIASDESTATTKLWQWLPGGGGDGGNVAVDNTGQTAVHYYFTDSVFMRDGARVQMSDNANDGPGTGLNATDKKNWYFPPNTFGGDGSFGVVTNPYAGSRILFGLTGLYESFNGGDNISVVTPAFNSNATVSALAYGNSNNVNAAYVGTSTGQLFFRTTSGAAFLPISTPPWAANAFAQKIVMDPDIPGLAYVLDNFGAIWAREPIGGTWTELDGSNIPGNPGRLSLLSPTINTIELYDPNHVPGQGVLLAGGLGGVFRLMLGSGDTCWRVYGREFPNVLVTDLHYIPPNPA
ncbi:MAG TPA: sialidase family protein, partial [Gemmataceae bacterium]|nr:sialidase family protein [Gemmataceae bacterium]